MFQRVNSKFLLIALVATLASIGLLCAGYLSIEALILIWNCAFVVSVMVWEKHRRENALSMNETLSNDERWSKIKRDIERIDGRLSKTKDVTKRKSLLYQKRCLENELRRVEWSIKESNLNGIYNAGFGNLPKLDSPKMSQSSSRNPLAGSEDGDELNSYDKYTPEGALRERKRLEKQAEERRSLERIVDNTEKILASEPIDSIPVALQSVANEFKAHYNVIKKRKNNSSCLADYWVAWALISSIINGLEVDRNISKYASKEFRPKIIKFIKLIYSLKLQTVPALPEDLGSDHASPAFETLTFEQSETDHDNTSDGN